MLALACQGDLEARLERVERLQAAGAYAESIEPLREILAEAPDSSEASFRMGLALLRTGSPSQAVWQLRKAADSEEYGSEAALLLASTLYSTRNFEAAVEAADRILLEEPDEQTALAIRARASLAAMRPADALDSAERISAIDPGSFLGLGLRAESLAALGRIDAAEEALLAMQEAAAEQPESVAGRACLALAEFYAKKLVDADRGASQIEACLERHPEGQVATAASLYQELGRPEDAIALLRRTLEESPRQTGLASTLANLLAGLGEMVEAEATLREAAEASGGAEAWRAVAQFREATGDLEGARQALETAIQEPDADESHRFVLADVLVSLGDPEQARQVAEGFEEQSFRDLLEGRIALEVGDPRRALELLELGLRRWPNNGPARLAAARAALELGDIPRAQSELREATRVAPRDSDAALFLARLYLAEGSFEAALDFAQRHARARPVFGAETHLIAVWAATALGQYSLARQSLRSLGEVPAFAGLALAEIAKVERVEHGVGEAVALLEGSGLDWSDDANALPLRALVGFDLERGESDRALARVDEALQRNSDSAQLHSLRGQLLLSLDREEEAAPAFERALVLEPNRAEALAGRGELALRAGEPLAALELFEQANEAAPDDPAHALGGARALRAAGRLDAADARVRRVLQHHPEYVPAMLELAELVAALGSSLDEAVVLAARAQAVQRSAETLKTMGFVRLQRGETDEALDALRRSLEKDPDLPSAHYYLGLALERKGDLEGALGEVQAALAAGPFADAKPASSALKRLEAALKARP